ncbi:hypothetical protein [Kineococcus sp. SYSU DK005]|uniref:hypothetical protein n=1 Tax=Kineococcus sp. SYSU DK005 TaxID=3383126 RepID=UPI003D7E5390
MSMHLCTDLTAAAWITQDPQPWNKLTALGPTGLPAYARLLFLPDPTHPGQSENQAPERQDGLCESDLLRTALSHLSAHTSTPEECYFLLWDGWDLHPRPTASPTGFPTGSATGHEQHRHAAARRGPARPSGDPEHPAPPAGAQPGVHPHAPGPRSGAALVSLPERAYYLFRGTIDDLGQWGPDLPATPSGWAPDPAFVWPADHAWCITRDVDPHYATIAASTCAITALLRERRLEVVPTDPDQPQPYYL